MGKLGRDGQFAFDARPVKIILRVLADVRGDVFEGVIPGIDRPNDLVQGLKDLARGQGNRVHFMHHFGRFERRAARMFAQEQDSAEFGAHLIVQILRDAGPFAFERALVLEPLQTLLQFPLFDKTDGSADGRQKAQTRQTHKPPCLPKMAQHRQ